MGYIKNVDPCKDERSTCVVRAGCHISKKLPWERTDKCPDYKKFSDRRDRRDNFRTNVIDNCFITGFFICCIFVAFLFVLGIMKFIEFFT